MLKEKCDNCQEKEIKPSSEGVYLGYYQDNNKDKRFHMCYDCYRDKEQEYLQNYMAFIYSYNPEHYQGTGYVKTDGADCYAGKKDQNGKILEQRECRHCSLWKFTDDKEKCANCGKEFGDTKDGKLLYSQECVDVHNRQSVPNSAKTYSVCRKNIYTNQRITYQAKSRNGEKKNYCSLECEKGNTGKNDPQQESPSKSQNINKGMLTEKKLF